MAVHDVVASPGCEPHDLGNRTPIAEAKLARHGNTGKPERAIVFEPTELHGDLGAAGAGICTRPLLGPELGFAKRKIVHVAEQAPNRCTHAMQDA